MKLTAHLCLAPRLKLSGAVPLLLLYVFMERTGTFYSTNPLSFGSFTALLQSLLSSCVTVPCFNLFNSPNSDWLMTKRCMIRKSERMMTAIGSAVLVIASCGYLSRYSVSSYHSRESENQVKGAVIVLSI